MPKVNAHLLSFNRGEIGKHALGRIDVEQLRLAAQTQLNFIPLTVGPMMFRPGTRYLGTTAANNGAKLVPFIFGTSDTALLEFTASAFRIWVDDALITAPSVSTTVTNGDFSSAAGWTLTTTSGASATIAGGFLALNALALGSSAFGERSVSVILADRGVEHRLTIVVARGPVTFQVGSTSGDEDYVARTTLGAGQHSIAFTPTGANFFPRFTTTTKTTKQVDSIQVASAGVVSMTTPYGASDLTDIRYAQSGDIVYIACDGFQQHQVERRDDNSWSIVLYEPTGGPYAAQPSWATEIVMDPDQQSGGTRTITAGSSYFTNNHLNSLLTVTCNGQDFQTDVAGSNRFTEPLKIEGITSGDRTLSYTISGTWVGLLSLQRSIEGPDSGFVLVANQTVNGAYTEDDSTTHGNVEAWYRVGFASGNYTSGAATVILSNGTGGGQGEARIFGINSALQARIEIVRTFPNNAGSNVWNPGDWSDDQGWPSSVDIYDGRLWWGGRDKIWGSVSDDFTNFDETFEGDAGPINRSFGSGPFANVNWIMGLGRLLAGRDSSVASIRASNLDAPLTPTDFTIKDCSSKGAAALAPLKVDTRGVYVDKSGRRVYALVYNVETYDYRPVDLTKFNADIGEPGFVDCAVQFQPDTRLHFVRADGQVAVMTYEFEEGVEAWWRILIGGSIDEAVIPGRGGDAMVESVCVLPGDLEDAVYYVVLRTVNGVGVRYIEKLARQDECIGGTVNKIADAHIVYSGSAVTTITGLSHLEAEDVVVWGNGKDLGTYTVSGGQITGVSEAVTDAVVGLSYVGKFQSAKLAYAAALGSPMNQKKKIDHLGLMLIDTHYQGLEYGPDFDTMDPLPLVEEGEETAADTIWSEFDAPMIEFPGEWHTDSRLCLRATAPRPATVGACVIGITTHG